MAKIHTIPCGFVNCYLIEDDDSLVLVDAATGKDRERIVRQVRKLGFSPEDISLIFLTHGHLDHAGSANDLKDRYDIPIAMSEADIDVLRPMTGKGSMGRILLTLSKSKSHEKNHIVPDVPLQEGMSLARYGLFAEVVSLPGHTQGSMALLFDDGKLIAGDMFMNFTSPSLAHIAEDHETMKQSLNKLKKLHPAVVYPGHGKPFGFSQVL